MLSFRKNKTCPQTHPFTSTARPEALDGAYDGVIGNVFFDCFDACGNKKKESMPVSLGGGEAGSDKGVAPNGETMLGSNEKQGFDEEVQNLLAKRPSFLHWNRVKDAFAACLEERKRAVEWRLYKMLFSSGVLFGLFALRLCFPDLCPYGPIVQVSSLLASIILFVWAFDRYWHYYETMNFGLTSLARDYDDFTPKYLEKACPRPTLTGFMEIYSLDDISEVRLTTEQLQQFSESERARAYIRGVFKQPVPLLACEIRTLHKLAKRDENDRALRRILSEGD